MTEERGTLDGLVGLLTTLVGPLTGLGTGAAPALFAQLGLPVTEAQAQTLAPTLAATTGAVGDLMTLVSRLETAVQSGQPTAILAAVNDAGQRLAALVNGVGQLTVGLGALGLPGAGPILANLPERLVNLLLVRVIDRAPGVTALLEFLGVLVRTDHNVVPVDPAQPFFTENVFHFDRLAGWITDPKAQLATLYGWGTPGFTGAPLLSLVDRIAGEAGFPSFYDPTATPPTVDLLLATLTAQTGITPRGVAVHFPGGLAPATVERTGRHWKLTVALDTAAPADTALVLQPGKVSLQPPDATTVTGTASVTYSYVRDAADPVRLLAFPGGSRVTVEEIGARLALTAGAGGAVEVALGATLKRGQVVIDTGGADGFIASILGALRLQSSFELGALFSMAEGVHFQGSGALEVQLASHVSLGPLEIPSLTLIVGVSAGELVVGLAADLKVSLGPLTGIVQGIGTEIPLALAAGNKGNLGPLDVRPRFKPPTGIGLAIDLAVISGGGFLSYDDSRKEYAGALELSLLDLVTVKAIGLLSTRMPDGSPGFSLLLILTADFGPGFQLGFGFTLNAVGGLVGINRTMLFQPLMDGVRTGAIESVMFPKDVIANAPRIISDLRAIFPPQADTFLIGPMAKLGWGEPTLVSLSLGVIIQIPPGDIAILGVLKVALPADELAIIVLQVNFAGALEFSKQRIYFFASLFDSRVLFITVEGEMGLLVAWGDRADFVISVGGFHPQFNPPPLPFPTPRRVAVSIINESFARIRADGYFAVTTNTVQFGAHSEYFFGFDALSVSGHSGFDALIQFSPFHFVVSVDTSFSVKVFGIGVFGIGISLTVSGPTPWHAQGTASLEFFFFSVDVGIDLTFGDSRETTLPPVAVMPVLATEFGKRSNWRAVLPAGSNLLVSLRPLPEAEKDMVLHPVGTLQVSQRAVPLDLTIDTFGHSKPSDANRFSLTVDSPALTRTRDLQEPFAPSQFRQFDDAAKLSQPAFSPQDSGVELTAGRLYATGAAICRVVRYDVIIIDTKLRRAVRRFSAYVGSLFHFGLRGNAAARSTLSRHHEQLTRPFEGTVTVHPEAFTVAFAATNTAYHPGTFTSQASAEDFLARTVADRPDLHGTLHVLPGFEVVPS